MRGCFRVVAMLACCLVLVAMGPAPAFAADCRSGLVALTFDDGPGAHTPAVLDVLARHEVKATFFVVGTQVTRSPETLRRVAAEGHVVANHAHRHEKLTGLSDAGIRTTVGQAAAAIAATGVRAAPLVRPPYGATDARVASVLRAAGYTQVMWSVDPRDWAGTSPDGIVGTVVAGLAPGAVVVLHDGSSRAPNTIAALPRIIGAARGRGFCFGVLDDRGRVTAPTPVARRVAPPVVVDGIAGENRFHTSVRLSEAGWREGAASAVLASGLRYPDALSASVLAGVTDGPLLLTPESRLDPAVAGELARLGVEHVYLVGPLGDEVEAAVQAMGAATARLRGTDRYDTSALIAEEARALGADTTTVLVATGEDFADALAASVLAAGLRHPIVLTRASGAGGAQPPPDERQRLGAVLAGLGAQRTWVVGGAAAVPDAAIEGLPGVARLAGANRAATAAALADRAVADGFAGAPLIASGQSFPDGLAGGVLAARLRRPLLVTSATRLSPEVHGWTTAHATTAVTVIGGPTAVGAGPRCQLATGLDGPDGCAP